MKTDSINRRQMFRHTAMAAGVAATFPSTAAADSKTPAKTELKKGDVILFQGDSITDGRRNRKEESHPNHFGMFGNSYALFAASGIMANHPTHDLKIYNRGISGNRVPHLQARWKKDCLDLKPAVLSILIGVNDIWHKMNGAYDGTVESYKTGYAALLKQTREALPDTKIVICEPFVMRCGAVKNSWFPEFDQRRAVAKELAEANGTFWVPFQKFFDEAVAAGTKPEHWARDGVHPSFAGHSLMAQKWREVVGI